LCIGLSFADGEDNAGGDHVDKGMVEDLRYAPLGDVVVSVAAIVKPATLDLKLPSHAVEVLERIGDTHKMSQMVGVERH
jgi:hypothetical protein